MVKIRLKDHTQTKDHLPHRQNKANKKVKTKMNKIRINKMMKIKRLLKTYLIKKTKTRNKKNNNSKMKKNNRIQMSWLKWKWWNIWGSPILLEAKNTKDDSFIVLLSAIKIFNKIIKKSSKKEYYHRKNHKKINNLHHSTLQTWTFYHPFHYWYPWSFLQFDLHLPSCYHPWVWTCGALISRWRKVWDSIKVWLSFWMTLLRKWLLWLWFVRCLVLGEISWYV